ncbi:unnamed protein product [Soboliphyme baturini]|uniref:Uncharacterized protein n=1 Tax=Soboliphyme baturini TaxID=241478 RepID=A0A183IA01_9BILA|nr:unnamed protein product [Soboliphyme baturini]
MQCMLLKRNGIQESANHVSRFEVLMSTRGRGFSYRGSGGKFVSTSLTDMRPSDGKVLHAIRWCFWICRCRRSPGECWMFLHYVKRYLSSVRSVTQLLHVDAVLCERVTRRRRQCPPTVGDIGEVRLLLAARNSIVVGGCSGEVDLIHRTVPYIRPSLGLLTG